MPITLSGGKILYTQYENYTRSEYTGVIPDSGFAVCDDINVLKQIKFEVSPQTSGQGTLTIQCDISGDQTINLTSAVLGGNSFTTIQPDFGTSPVADSATDTLTLTSSDSTITITGDSTTDTINFTNRVATSSVSGIVSTITQQFTGQKEFFTHSAANATVMLSAIASQTGYLLHLKNSSGSQIGGITVAGYFMAPSGSGSGSAAYGFQGDSNTGLISTGADSWSGVTGGSERFRISSVGRINVGQNYTDTIGTLHVSSIASNVPTISAKAVTAQSADLFQALNTSNTPLVGITASGQFYAGTNGIPTLNTSHSFTSISDGNTTLGLKVRSSGTQTADLISIFNSADTEIAQLNVEAYWYLPAGLIGAPSYTFYGDAKYGMYHPSKETRLVSEEKFLGVDKYGNIRVICHDNSAAIGNSSNQEIRSGESFAPTFSNQTNISISVTKINWLRIGNDVTVGVYGMATTSSYNYSFEMDLPVSSDFTNDYKAGGIGVIQLPDKEESTFSICAEPTNNTVYCQGYDVNGGGLSEAKFNMHFTYTVQ